MGDMRVWEDIYFAARVVRRESHWVAFEILQVDGVCAARGAAYFHKKGSGHYPDPVEDPDDADVYAHGEVKWDGCSNWSIDEQDRCALHSCSRNSLLHLGVAMARCWDWSRELIDAWDGAAVGPIPDLAQAHGEVASDG